MDKLNIYQKLLEVRKKIEPIKKQKSENKLGYDFVSSSQVLIEIKHLLDEQRLFLVPELIEDELITNSYIEKQHYKNGNVVEKNKTIFFTKVKMKYTWIDCDNPENHFSVNWSGHGLDHGTEKGIGKAYSYSEKYFLLKFFNIATDDLDADVESNKNIMKLNNEKFLREEIQLLKKEIESTKKDKQHIINEYNKLASKIKNKAAENKSNNNNNNKNKAPEYENNDNNGEVEEEAKEIEYIDEKQRKKLFAVASSEMLKNADIKVDSYEIVKKCIAKKGIDSTKKIPVSIVATIETELKQYISIKEKKYMKEIEKISTTKADYIFQVSKSFKNGEKYLESIIKELIQKKQINAVNLFEIPDKFYTIIRDSLLNKKKELEKN